MKLHWPFGKSRLTKSVGGIWGVGAARFMNHRYQSFANEGYGLNPIVNACISKIANSIASVDPTLFKKQGSKLTKIEQHPILDLLNSPNPTMGTREFMRQLVSFYLIGGNTYVLGTGFDPLKGGKQKPPKELYLLRPEATSVVPGSGVFPDKYTYRQLSSGKMEEYPVNQLTGLSQILHLRTVNPLDQWTGLSPMVAASYGIDTFNSGMRWNKALLDNDARPSGAFTVVDENGKPTMMGEEQYQRLQEQIEQNYGGAKNAGRPMILEGGLSWTQMSMSNKDMDHEKNLLNSARFVAAVYHTPPQLVNIPGESTYNNYEQAKLAFWVDNIIPLLGQVLEGLNRWLVPMFGDLTLELGYDEDKLAALEPMRKEKHDRVNDAKYLTTNEKRIAMGYDTLPADAGGDYVMVPGLLIPLDLAGTVDPRFHAPLPAGDQTQGGAPGKPAATETNAGDTGKERNRKFLISMGYDEERAARVAALMSGE